METVFPLSSSVRGAVQVDYTVSEKVELVLQYVSCICLTQWSNTSAAFELITKCIHNYSSFA